MTVVAINKLSAESVETAQKQAVYDQFKEVLMDDEVKAALKAKALTVINEMSTWDVAYHADFKGIAESLLRADDAIKDAAFKTLLKALSEGDGGDPHWRIFEAIGEAVVEKMELKITK